MNDTYEESYIAEDRYALGSMADNYDELSGFSQSPNHYADPIIAPQPNNLTDMQYSNYAGYPGLGTPMIESDIYNNNVAVSNNSSEMNNNNQSRNHYADPKTVNNPTQVVRASKKRKLNNSESSSEETAREHFLQKIYQLCLTEGSGIDFHPCVEFCGVCINDKTKFEQSYGPTHGSVDNNFKTWQFYKLLRNGKTFWYYKPNPYLFNSELNGDVSQFISATQARGKETENYERYQKLFHDKHAAKILWDNNLICQTNNIIFFHQLIDYYRQAVPNPNYCGYMKYILDKHTLPFHYNSTQGQVIPIQTFNHFLSLFGPWSKIEENLKLFIIDVGDIYHLKTTKDDAELILREQAEGFFLLRDSTQPATFALSVNIGNGEIEHWRLRREPQGYLIDAKAEHTMLYTTISEVIKTFNTTFKHRFRNGEIQNDCNTDQLIAQMKNSHISCDKPRGYVKVVPKQSNNDHTTTSLQMPSFPEVLYNMNFASVLITEPDTTSNNVTAQSILAANVPRKIKISNKGGPKANAVKIKNENQLKSCTYAQLVEELVQCFKIGANEFRFMELQCKEFSGDEIIVNNQEEWINIVDDDEELAKIECIYFVCEK